MKTFVLFLPFLIFFVSSALTANTMTNESLLQQCAMSLCGESMSRMDQRWNASNYKAKLEQTTRHVIEARIPGLKQIFAKNQENLRILIEKYKSIDLKNNFSLNVNDLSDSDCKRVAEGYFYDPSYCLDENGKSKIQQKLDSLFIPTEIQKIESEISQLDYLESKLNTCRSNLAEAYFQFTLPEIQEEDLTKFKEKISAFSSSYFGDDLKKRWEQYYQNKLMIKIPKSSVELKDSLIKDFDKYQKYSEYDLPTTERKFLLISDKSTLQSALINLLDFYENKLDAHKSILVCRGNSFLPGMNAMRPHTTEEMAPYFSRYYPDISQERDQLFLSYQVVSEKLEAVIIHELAHAFSNFILKYAEAEEKSKFLQLRSCATSLNASSSEGKTTDGTNINIFEGDIKTTEEDTADQIMYYLQKEEAEIVGCSHLTTNWEGTKFDSHSFDGHGTHSPSLVRILREASYKGVELNKACLDSIDYYQHQWNFDYCL